MTDQAQQVNFSQDDFNKAVSFGAFINEHARWDLKTSQSNELTRHLVWYNNMANKIKANIMELTNVIKPPEKKDK